MRREENVGLIDRSMRNGSVGTYRTSISGKKAIKFAMVVLFFFLFASNAFGVILTNIHYDVELIDPGRWQYTYEVKNLSLAEGIEEFTIWFDHGLYENLLIETQHPLALEWDEIVIQPEIVFEDDGFYDSISLTGPILSGESVGDFSVSFDWLGVGMPGSQLYEIIDPGTFEAIDSGSTIPEPATFLLLGIGALALRTKRKGV